MLNPLVKLENIYKSYRDSPCVLTQINLSIFLGQLVSVVGVSGSGKSTLLQIIGLLDNYDKGSIYFGFNSLSTNFKPDKVRLNHIGFVYQYHYLLKDFTVLENVMMPAIIHGISFSKAKRQAQVLLDQVHMLDKKDVYPISLSGGQAQRVALIRSLINNPSLIIADEPTGNLDKENANIVIGLLRNFVSKGSACIFATHDLALAKLSDVTYILSEGKLSLYR